MRPEILSTARPSKLRLAGFLCLVAGAIAAGIGSTREWASIGFRADVQHAVDVSVRGTDVWEGKVVLFAAGAALFAMLAMRLASAAGTRRVLAIGLVALGLAGLVLPVMVVLRPEARFGGGGGSDRLVEHIAAEVGQPEDVVRDQFEQELRQDLRVDLGSGPWLSVAGGVLLVAGGVLSFAWIRQREPARQA